MVNSDLSCVALLASAPCTYCTILAAGLAVIREETLRNIIIAGIAVAVVTLVLLANIAASAIVLLMLAMVDINVLGFMVGLLLAKMGLSSSQMTAL